ncbi:MAG: magnesium transporter [Polyangiaceae bacterium UTPRO1]|jgi:magnesium transporter|nr:magnesium transporter [Myxococcales bacterium]OQY66889.1 MAG: magnesium transporter [Polyangiaceae bacterium UTPRO1]
MTDTITHDDLVEAWPLLDTTERLQAVALLPRPEAEDLFLTLPTRDQAELVVNMEPAERRMWLRLLAPDDVADLLQEAPAEDRAALLGLLDPATRGEVTGLLAYAEDQAGGLMNPHYARLRPEMSVAEVLAYLHRFAREHSDGVYYAYVLDADLRLLGTVSFRELFAADPLQRVRDVMRPDPVTVPENLDQEEVSKLFAAHHFLALPVVDALGRMKGVVTIDDVVDVVREEATEDIQKIGGTEALGAPYLAVGFPSMIRKRAGWLSALFLGELLTATAMGRYEDEIARAVVLALFVPLIISSGGNSGSQATTLVIRAMALGEVGLRDWWRVIRRELASGLVLGCILAVIGLVRILVWQSVFHAYGTHYALVAATVGLSLIGVVTFGTLAGSMLPFVLRRLGFDPASASAPFVATLVDVTGLVIYFTVASVVLRGTLL